MTATGRAPDLRLSRVPPHRLPELIERPDCDVEALEAALNSIARASRASGGWRPMWHAVEDLLTSDLPDPLRVLDVGAGNGELAVAVFERVRAAGRQAELVLADVHPRALCIARSRIGSRASRAAADCCAYVRLTAPRLPFATGSIALAMCATTLHHLEWTEAVAFLCELERVTLGRWVVIDLRRSWLSYLSLRLLAVSVWRRRAFPRVDGPVSIRRSFTPAEARRLVSEAGLPGAEARASDPFRLVIRGRGDRQA